MTQATFFDSLCWELHLRGQSFHRADVRLFVADAWTWIEEDPNLSRWAREYAEARQPATAERS